MTLANCTSPFMPSPQPNHQLGLLQGQINWRIWKYWQFGREVNQLFDLLPRNESVQEVLFRSCSRHFRPTWKSCNNSTNWRNLHSDALTQSLVQNIMRSLPLEVRPSFNNQFTQFQELNADNVQPPTTFLFLAQYVNKLPKKLKLHGKVIKLSAIEEDLSNGSWFSFSVPPSGGHSQGP